MWPRYLVASQHTAPRRREDAAPPMSAAAGDGRPGVPRRRPLALATADGRRPVAQALRRLAAAGAVLVVAAVPAAASLLAVSAPTRADGGAGMGEHRAFLPWSAVNAVRPLGSVPTAAAPPTAAPSSPTAAPAPTDAPTAAPPTMAPTNVPTDAPTAAPTPTATALPSPTAAPPLDCRELVPNGDFEAGAKRWSLIVTSARQEAARAIQNATRLGFAPHSGTYAAWLGALPDSTMDLESDPLAKIDPARVVSATLSAAVVIVTNGPRNRHADDTFAIVLDGARGEVRPEPLRLNDESWNEPWVWHVRHADVTTLLQRDTYSRVRVRVQSDAEDATWFYFDDISLRACTSGG